MRIPFALFLFASLAACGAEFGHERGEGFYTPPELEPLRETAISCFQDSDLVPIEHSEHCVIVAETIFEHRKVECDGSRSKKCLEYQLASADIHAIYRTAMIGSLLKFDTSEEIKAAAEETVPHHVYYDGELLRRLFYACLNDEQEALSKNGLKRVSRLPLRRLGEGQMCIREGYPEFEVQEI